MVKVEVEPGICGHHSTIKVLAKNEMTAEVVLESQCEHIDAMNRELKEIDVYQECFKKHDESKILALGRKYCQHSSCPVPMSICKGLEVAFGIAEPKNVNVKISRE